MFFSISRRAYEGLVAVCSEIYMRRTTRTLCILAIYTPPDVLQERGTHILPIGGRGL